MPASALATRFQTCSRSRAWRSTLPSRCTLPATAVAGQKAKGKVSVVVQGKENVTVQGKENVITSGKENVILGRHAATPTAHVMIKKN